MRPALFLRASSVAVVLRLLSCDPAVCVVFAVAAVCIACAVDVDVMWSETPGPQLPPAYWRPIFAYRTTQSLPSGGLRCCAGRLTIGGGDAQDEGAAAEGAPDLPPTASSERGRGGRWGGGGPAARGAPSLPETPNQLAPAWVLCVSWRADSGFRVTQDASTAAGGRDTMQKAGGENGEESSKGGRPWLWCAVPLAVGETAILLHLPLPVVDVSIVMERGRQ